MAKVKEARISIVPVGSSGLFGIFFFFFLNSSLRQGLVRADAQEVCVPSP